MSRLMGELVYKITAEADSFFKQVDKASKTFDNASKAFTKAGKAMTIGVTLPILAIGAASVKAAADMEMQTASFETLLGSAEKAGKMLSEINALAAKTPFATTDLAKGAQTMLAFGVAQERILPNLRMLGDIAQGNAQKLESLTLAFSQIQSTGRLMGQDLLQLINAGFNPLTIISQKTGKSMADLKAEMEKGGISAEMVADAFKTATSEGGMFYQGMERASKTLAGQLSTLKDDATAVLREFGTALIPVLKDVVASASKAVKAFSGLDDGTKKLIITVAGVLAAVGPVLLSLGKAIEMIPAVTNGVDLLKTGLGGLKLGWVGVALAIGTAIVALLKWIDNANTKKTTESLSAALFTFEKDIVATRDAADKLAAGLVQLTKETAYIVNGFDQIAMQTGEKGSDVFLQTSESVLLLKNKYTELADSMGLTTSQVLEAALAQTNLSDSMREVIKSLQSWAYAQSMADANSADGSARRIKATRDAAAAAKQATDAAAAQAVAEANANAKIKAREAALKATQDGERQIQRLLNNRIITQEEANKRLIALYNTEREALSNLNYAITDTSTIGGRRLAALEQAVNSLSNATENLKNKIDNAFDTDKGGAGKSLSDFNTELELTTDQIVNMINAISSVATDAISGDFTSAITSTVSTIGQLTGSTELQIAGAVVSAIGSVSDALNDMIKGGEKAQRELKNLEVEFAKTLEEDKLNALKKAYDIEKEYLDKKREDERLAHEEKLTQIDDALQAELMAKGLAEKTAIEKATEDLAIANVIEDRKKAYFAQKELEKAEIEAKYAAQRQSELDAEEARKKAYDEARIQAEKDYLNKKSEYDRQRAQYEKELKVMEVQSAMEKALADMPWYSTPQDKAKVQAMYLSMLQRINSLPLPEPPQFAMGVRNFRVPDGYNNDNYPIMVQSGETVDVKTPMMQANGDAGGNTVHIHIGNLVADDASLRDLETRMTRARLAIG